MKKKLLALTVATAIAGTTTLGVTSAYEVTYHPEANVSYTLNGNENFTGGLITITDGTETYTIMDRNLGATSTGVDSSDSYGYYFQWGNNYGFPTAGSVAKSSTQVDASGYGPGNYYSSSTFITRSSSPWDRSSVQNDNLWGGVSGTYEAMQGPCPEGYHVPSSGEWLGLSTMLGYDGTYNSNASIQARDRLNTELYLPFAGYRDYSSAGVYNQGTNARYWSSTAYSADTAYRLYFNSAGLNPQNGNRRSDGFSVRCFKDSPYSASDLSCEEGETYYPELGVCATKGENGIYYSRDADENNDITICDPSSNGTKCITMQDKNLGATKAGTGCSASDTGACGFHFQWGNNHGFEIGCYIFAGCSDVVTSSATGKLATWSSNFNHIGYNIGTTFIIGSKGSKWDYWDDNNPSIHDGLRGGENDTGGNNYGYDKENNVATNVENRRGPCGDGYHVPSIGERNKVLEYWAEENNVELFDIDGLLYNNYDNVDFLGFQEDFKIPFAGYRGNLDAKIYQVGGYAELWSSSPNVGNVNAHSLYLVPNDLNALFGNRRAHALSLRCFKDSYLEFPSSEEECPEGTHAEGDECVANYSTRLCSIYSTPANATSIRESVDITWNESGWSEPEPCDWYCNAGYHRVGDECVVNYQQTGCSIYSTPANATSITGKVGIIWNGSGWSEPEACDWYCNAGYHKVGNVCVKSEQPGEEECPEGTHAEGDECVANYSTRLCSIYSTPANATSIRENVDITWNGSGWSEPEPCDWYCNALYHRVGDECVVDYQQTGCSIYSTPANATSITGNVGITWNGSGWSEPEPCDWYCNAGYHKVGNACVVNYQQTGCAQIGKPENSVYNIVNVLGAWNSGTNSRDIPACSWTCGPHYHTGTNGNTCEADIYTITFIDGSGENTDIIRTGGYGSLTSGNIEIPSWTKNGYVLSWNREIPDIVPAENIVITAIWTKKQSSGIGGGGGGGSSLRKDKCPDGDYSDSYYDGICGEKPKHSSATPQNDTGTTKDDNNNLSDDLEYDTSKFNPKYSDEMNMAYQYAYYYGITTKSPIVNADMNGKLTRIAMAKMLSQYAIKVLGMKPDTTRQKTFSDVSTSLDLKYDNGVTLAYQLGIMGINMPDSRFRPYDYVPRAEFVTALSRMLYKTPDGEYAGTPKYYTNHMNLLERLGILTNTDPKLVEKRGYIMLMLMRSAK